MISASLAARLPSSSTLCATPSSGVRLIALTSRLLNPRWLPSVNPLFNSDAVPTSPGFSGPPRSPPCFLLTLPCVLGGGVSCVAYRAQLGRLGGSGWGWVLQIKYRAIQTNVLSFSLITPSCLQLSPRPDASTETCFGCLYA